jgi:hypothetical protein
MKYPNATTLKRGLLFVWAAWLTVVVATNVCDGARALGLLPESWAFASGNYDFLVKTTLRYAPPDWLNGLLFVGVVGWEAIACVLFWLAGLRFSSGNRGTARTAFAVGLGLWAAFMLADEICIAYLVEGTHLRLFTAQLVSLLVVELLPADGK